MSTPSPRRWLDSAEAPIGARELLSAARPTRAMPDAAFGRGLARVAKTTAAPVAVAAGVTLWVKIAAAGLAVAAVVGSVAAVHVVSSRDAERGERAQQQPLVVAAAPVSAPAASVRGGVPEPEAVTEPASASASASAPATASASASASASAPSESPPSSTLLAELPLLERARRSLASDPESALATAREHRARFPAGLLAAERDLLELDALRRTGRTDLARANADAWLAREPSGVSSARVRAIRESLPDGASR